MPDEHGGRIEDDQIHERYVHLRQVVHAEDVEEGEGGSPQRRTHSTPEPEAQRSVPYRDQKREFWEHVQDRLLSCARRRVDHDVRHCNPDDERLHQPEAPVGDGEAAFLKSPREHLKTLDGRHSSVSPIPSRVNHPWAAPYTTAAVRDGKASLARMALK